MPPKTRQSTRSSVKKQKTTLKTERSEFMKGHRDMEYVVDALHVRSGDELIELIKQLIWDRDDLTLHVPESIRVIPINAYVRQHGFIGMATSGGDLPDDTQVYSVLFKE